MEKLISHYLAAHTDIEAQDFIKNFLCSTCYGHLVGHLTDEGTLVLCAKCHLETKGYVTKHYAEKRRQESYAERAEAAHVLQTVIPSSSHGKTEAELLKDLGF